MNNIENKIKKIISNQLELPFKKILNTDFYTKNLHADSLDIIELIMSFEKEFNIQISDEDAEQLTNVQNTIDYIYNKINN
ncbi:acyl carrier protein [Buchnera aphidicola]|uniref:acyl carrier protein n=1 Tax=Buchnera aphidicola TaxID=9 RepID=UPI003463F10B